VKLGHPKVGALTARTSRSAHRLRVSVVAASAAIGLLAAGCSSSSSSSSSTTTTAATTSTTRSALSALTVRALQAALLKVGCYTGRVDGIAGSLTTAALQAFQAAEGLPVDGVYGTSTKAKLASAAALGTRVCASTPTTTTTGATTTTTAGGSAPAGALAAINAYESANGPAAGTWQITSTQVSAVDPTYVLFRIGPAPGYQNQVQGGYGFVHDEAGTWTVISFGSALVGCTPSSAQAPVVPAAVLSGFGLSCPPGA